MIFNYIRACFRKMSSSTSVLTPSGVRGMKDLDREKFLRTVQVPVLKVGEEKLGKITKICKPYFLKIENFKPIQNIEASEPGTPKKYIHLNPEIVNKWTDISKEDQTKLNEYNIDENNFQIKDIQLTYENWRYEPIFKAVLPENEEIVSSFSQIGHIIHLNLKDHLLEYRRLIGQVLLDKIKICRTVVNKSNVIDNTYRNFKMEVLAGEEDFLVTVKENQCMFEFDFSKVYWNPRLGQEHSRILSYLKPGDILFDIFCGVGPFAVPAAKRKIHVFANDLNPDSYKWLNHSAKRNKINERYFKSYNLDGKDFICNIFKNKLEEYCNGSEKLQEGAKIHITMNLPALAVEFLKHFKGLIKEDMTNFNHEIIVYIYCFAIGDNPAPVAKQMVIENIGCDVSDDILDVFDVRNVSPKKEMMRVTLRLTKKVLCDLTKECCEPPSKKVCVKETE